MNPFTFIERLMKSSLKIIAIIALFVIVVPALFWMGIAMDFRDFGTNKGNGSMWFLFLPVVGTVALIYGLTKLSIFMKQRKLQHMNPTLTSPKLPFQILEVIRLNPHSDLNELKLLTGSTSDELLPQIRTLIATSKIKQRIENGTAYFYPN